ncbi:MAG: helix-turn-helix transcriptional regulator, partial [Solirubrobacterales bacterium]|nr:helix-turn-helix transcriptional regulator [Solirubrobacterales bacterium]
SSTHAPINLIAAAVGYRSNAAFTRAFSKQYGITPTEWRRAQTRASGR